MDERKTEAEIAESAERAYIDIMAEMAAAAQRRFEQQMMQLARAAKAVAQMDSAEAFERIVSDTGPRIGENDKEGEMTKYIWEMLPGTPAWCVICDWEGATEVEVKAHIEQEHSGARQRSDELDAMMRRSEITSREAVETLVREFGDEEGE